MPYWLNQIWLHPCRQWNPRQGNLAVKYRNLTSAGSAAYIRAIDILAKAVELGSLRAVFRERE